jgi:hypothetical protein
MSKRFGNVAAVVGLTVSLFTAACGNAEVADDIGADQVEQESNGATQLYDDFRNGFSATQATDKWAYFGFGPAFTGNDGIESTSTRGLRVVSKGRNSQTGEPAFTSSVVQESSPASLGLPGGVDHVKWLVYANRFSSHGYPGFDATTNRQVGCEAYVGGQTYGTNGHPFGSAVRDANDDLRLAAFAMNVIDVETFMVFDIFMTNEGIYAFYERLPFGRGPGLGNYAAFSFAKRVADNSPGEQHKLGVSYDKRSNTVVWTVDGREVQRVSRVGLLIDRQNMVLDHGGTPTEVSLNQLNCGMGTFTLLDANAVGRGGLAKLSTAPGFYYNPATGEPNPETFTDPASADGSRLFGQGAELNVKKYNLFLAEESKETSLLGSVQGREVKRARYHRVRNAEADYLGYVQSGFGPRLVRIVVELTIPAAQPHDRSVSVT